MLHLPTTLTAREAKDIRRLLIEGMKNTSEPAAVMDAANLQQFDSAALAVLLECQRAANALSKPFELRNAPPKLAALAKLYGVDMLLIPATVPAAQRVDASAPQG
jgi:phospholipid transport system transporter-binding protein